MQQAFGLILRFHQFLALFVRFGIGFGVADHLFDVLIRQAARGLDGDCLLFVGAFVLGFHRHDAVGVDVKRHLDLRQTTRSRRDLFKVELAQHLVVSRHFTFALEAADAVSYTHLDVYKRQDLYLKPHDSITFRPSGSNAFGTQRYRCAGSAASDCTCIAQISSRVMVE